MNRLLRRSTAPRRERGAALLTAMIIVTLVATLAAGMVWQQWRAVQVEAAERARAQAQWILLGAVDWARLILREDNRTKKIDHLGEPWALPLAEAKLSTFLAADRDNTDDAPDAFLSGSIGDAQARYNLRNVATASGSLVEENTVLRLFEIVGARPEAAQALIVALRQAGPQATLAPNFGATGTPNGDSGNTSGETSGPNAGSGGTESGQAATGDTATKSKITVPQTSDPPLMPERLDQLTWLGLDADSLQRIAPFVTILPQSGTPINANTASKEVLAAVLDTDLATAERIVQSRQPTPFDGHPSIKPVPAGANEAVNNPNRLATVSSYFEIRGRLRLQDRVVEERALVRREENNDVRILQRERVTALDSVTPSVTP